MQFSHDQRSFKGKVQCYNCRKYGHAKNDCWYKDKSINMAEGSVETNLFMAHYSLEGVANNVRLIDSGCSNHMTGKKEIFRKLDECKNLKVKLGDDKEIQVGGEGTVAITTISGKTKLLHNVQYVPSLAHNL